MKHSFLRDKFLSELGQDSEEIMIYCLGENWKSESVPESRIKFNQKLNLNINESENLIDSANKIKLAWILLKRESILNEILN
jgi:hypothetical protein